MGAPTHDVDVVVIGGGIAGVSAAAAVAPRRRVVLVEQEARLAQHATGRSAASYVASYGPAPIRSLTRASRAALVAMVPDGAPVLTPRPLLWAAFDDEDVAALDRLCQEVPSLERIDRRELRLRHDALRGDRLEGAVETEAYDLDALTVHQCYVRAARAHGVEIWRGARVLGATTGVAGRIIVETTAGRRVGRRRGERRRRLGRHGGGGVRGRTRRPATTSSHAGRRPSLSTGRSRLAVRGRPR